MQYIVETEMLRLATGDIVTLPISALVRLNCDCDTTNLIIVIGGQVVTAQNLAFMVEKI